MSKGKVDRSSRRIQRRGRFLASATAAAIAAVVAGRAHAVTYLWTGTGSGNWSSSSNWSGGTVALSAVDTQIFYNPASGVNFTSNNDIASPFILNSMIFLGGSTFNPTVSGGTLQFVPNGAAVASLTVGATNATPYTIQNAILMNNDLSIQNIGSLSPALTFAGQISGGGKLKLNGGSFAVTSPNTYTGGTDVIPGSQFGHLFVTGSGNLGSGSVNVTGGSRLVLDSASNITSGPGSVKVNASYFQLNTITPAGLALLSSDSTGVIALGSNSSAAIDFTNFPGMRLGSWLPGGAPNLVAYSGTITPAADNIYRFGGQDSSNTDLLGSDMLTITSQLTDAPGGAPRSVDIRGISTNTAGSRGGRVKLLNGSNSYTGGTFIGTGTYSSVTSALVIDFSPAAGTTPLGTGDVVVNGGVLDFEALGRVGALPNNFIFNPGSTLMFSNMTGNNPWTIFDGIDRWPDNKPVALTSAEIAFQTIGSGPHVEKIGTVTFSGKSQMTTDNQQGITPSTTIAVSALNRVGRATMYLFGRQIGGGISPQPFGILDQFQTVDATGLVAPNGMVVPWILGADRTGGTNAQPVANFLQLDANNIFQFFPPVTFSSGTDDEVAFNPLSSIPSNETCWALRSSNLAIGAGITLTIKSGGLITSGFSGASVTLSGSGTLRFGLPGNSVEGLIYTSQNDATISCAIDGTGGLTKWGPFWLTLSGANTFTGGVQINDGNIRMGTATALNNNPVDIEGLGVLDLNALTVAVPSLTGAGIVANNTSNTTGTLIVNNSADCTFAGTMRSTIVTVGTTTIQRHVALVKNGPATFTLTGANTYLGGTTVNAGRLVANKLSNGSLTINGGTAQVTAKPKANDASGTTIIPALSIAPGGTLDVTNNSLVIDYTGPVGSLVGDTRVMLQSGRLTSSLADAAHKLGYGDNAVLGKTTFAGASVDSSTILVKYTFGGDANLDGQVDVTDLGALATNWQTSAPWTGGDFNYDGFVDVTDLGALATNWQAGVGSPLGPGSLEQAMQSVGLSGMAVPEPASLVLAGTILGMTRRRGKFKHPR